MRWFGLAKAMTVIARNSDGRSTILSECAGACSRRVSKVTGTAMVEPMESPRDGPRMFEPFGWQAFSVLFSQPHISGIERNHYAAGSGG